MIKELALGRPASEIFEDLMKVDPSLSEREISRLVAIEFPKIDGAAIQFIRRWHRFNHNDKVSDANLNAAVTEFLTEAGYLKTTT